MLPTVHIRMNYFRFSLKACHLVYVFYVVMFFLLYHGFDSSMFCVKHLLQAENMPSMDDTDFLRSTIM